MRMTLELKAIEYAGKAQRFTDESLTKEMGYENENEKRELLQKLFQDGELKYEPMYVYRYVKDIDNFSELESSPCLASIFRYARKVKLFTFSSLQAEIEKTEATLKRNVQKLVEYGCLERTTKLAYRFVGEAGKIEELLGQRSYLEKRRQELLNIMQMESKDEEDDEEEDFFSWLENAEDDCTDEKEEPEWEKLRMLALKKCIEKNRVSCSFLQTTLNIGYNKAQKILQWMEKENYITRRGRYLFRLTIEKKFFNVLCYRKGFSDLAFEEVRRVGTPYEQLERGLPAEKTREVCKVLQTGYTLSSGQAQKTIVELDMCYPNDVPYSIEIKEDEETCYFSDGGLTMLYLKENVDVQEASIAEKIENVIHQFNIKTVEGELHFKISSPKTAISVLMFFISAIDKLVDLAAIDCVHQACERLDEKCHAVIMEYFCAYGNLSREEVIAKAKDEQSKVEEGDKEKIVILEHVIQGFACISDEYYDTIKKEFMRRKADD